jgi:glutamine amidotransferase
VKSVPTIAIIDYDMGNLHSARQGLEMAGAQVKITHDRGEILNADGIVLPGVGAFDPAMVKLRSLGLDEVIRGAVGQGQPLLGICLGLQLLFARSAEGNEAGLHILEGTVERFQPEPDLTIPHMGWNQLQFTDRACELWQGLAPDPWVYFVHSYYPRPCDNSIISAHVTHGSQTVPVAIVQGKLMAVQFHPEKSGATGIQILKNFVTAVSNHCISNLSVPTYV